MKRLSDTLKAIFLWVITVLFIILCLPFLPSVSSFIFLAAALLVLPIEKWQRTISKVFTAKWKTLLVIGMVIVAFVCLPNATTDNAKAPTEESSATNPPTTDPTTLPTTPTEPATSPTDNPTEPTKPEHSHKFAAATCTKPKTCECGATEGSATGHKWSTATCIKPKTCSTCGETSGSANGHKYTSGRCSTCGAKDPNHNPITYILNIVTMKFHRPSCSRLPTDNREDTTMSREEIIAAGYDPCGICHP